MQTTSTNPHTKFQNFWSIFEGAVNFQSRHRRHQCSVANSAARMKTNLRGITKVTRGHRWSSTPPSASSSPFPLRRCIRNPLCPPLSGNVAFGEKIAKLWWSTPAHLLVTSLLISDVIKPTEYIHQKPKFEQTKQKCGKNKTGSVGKQLCDAGRWEGGVNFSVGGNERSRRGSPRR